MAAWDTTSCWSTSISTPAVCKSSDDVESRGANPKSDAAALESDNGVPVLLPKPQQNISEADPVNALAHVPILGHVTAMFCHRTDNVGPEEQISSWDLKTKKPAEDTSAQDTPFSRVKALYASCVKSIQDHEDAVRKNDEGGMKEARIGLLDRANKIVNLPVKQGEISGRKFMLSDARGAVGETLFHFAILRDQFSLALDLLRREPALLATTYWEKKYKGETVLHMLCADPSPQGRKMLVELAMAALHPPNESDTDYYESCLFFTFDMKEN